MILSPLTADHLDDVALLEAEVSPKPWPRDLFAGELDLSPAQRHWLVAHDEGSLCGFGGMMLVGDEAHLMNIAVAPAQRRRGVARLLLSRLIGDVVDLGARHLTLEVRPGNTAALSLYRHFAMVVAGSRKDYYGPGEDALILWAHDIHRSDHPGRAVAEPRTTTILGDGDHTGDHP